MSPLNLLLISMTSGTRPATRRGIALSDGIVSPRLDRRCRSGQVGGAALDDGPFSAGEPVELEIVEDDGLVVGGELHVAFDREAARDGGFAAESVFSIDARGLVVQAAMGDRASRRASRACSSDLEDPFDLDRGVERQLGDADGRAGMAALVAEHATIRSEAPFITGRQSPRRSARH